jgi:hypothetical protein
MVILKKDPGTGVKKIKKKIKKIEKALDKGVKKVVSS